jgi:hypothetical protein
MFQKEDRAFEDVKGKGGLNERRAGFNDRTRFE